MPFLDRFVEALHPDFSFDGAAAAAAGPPCGAPHGRPSRFPVFITERRTARKP
jgi:hypothetical protein